MEQQHEQQLTEKEMRVILKQNGWYLFWDDNLWLDGKKIYNGEIEGLTTVDAYSTLISTQNTLYSK
jgi:hypothetical protein